VQKILFLAIVVILLAPMILSSYALREVAGPIVLNMKPGEQMSFKWGLLSDSSIPINVTLSVQGNGSQFLSFPKSVTLPPQQPVYVSVNASIPSTYVGNSQFKPFLFATQAGQEGGPTILNLQVLKIVTLNINASQNIQFTAQNKTVPEFSFATLILLISIIFLVVFHRLGFIHKF
jgi:hypothetical protein